MTETYPDYRDELEAMDREIGEIARHIKLPPETRVSEPALRAALRQNRRATTEPCGCAGFLLRAAGGRGCLTADSEPAHRAGRQRVASVEVVVRNRDRLPEPDAAIRDAARL